jgi:ferredoxin-type protein NapH
MTVLIPFLIGCGVAGLLYFTVGWWGFLAIFPWIGFSISLGVFIQRGLPAKRKNLGRRISLLMILPMLLFFVPIVNHENFQLEGVVLLILAGFLGKGVIHLAVAKVFGPLIWGRGFCGWACWTAAVLEWLPIKKAAAVPKRLKNFRWLALALSLLLPVGLIFFLNFDVWHHYLYRQEMTWMFVGNGIYYAVAVPLAFALKDRRAFCKIVCPVSLVMKAPARLAAIKMQPSGEECTECGACNQRCPMDIDVMAYIKAGKKVTSTECILCDECRFACPQKAIK